MLSSEVSATPRPRPPAQARRVSSLRVPKPLTAPSLPISPSLYTPHRPALETLLGSPMPSIAAQMVGWDASSLAHDDASAEDTSWMNEKSREELSDLLVKADGLIKERETELGVTSAVCKSLFESNITLKSKHQALLARIPSSRGSSPPLCDSPPLLSPEYSGASLPRSITDSFLNSSSTHSMFHGHRRTRTRKISVSPSDIALLSDQNAELVEKLQKFEAESELADQAGRRALKKLESEIHFLREELEKTQAKSEELEALAKLGLGKTSAQEREAKLRRLRQKPDTYEDEEDEEIKDFSPGGILSSGPALQFPISPPRVRPASDSPKPSPDSTLRSQFVTDTTPSSSPSAPTPLDLAQPPQEYALISQLLLKIRELEETNLRIMEQQAETAAQLYAVRRESENISRVYDCFEDQPGVEWQLVVDDEDKSAQPVARAFREDTINFRSLRRSLDMATMMALDVPGDDNIFDNGIESHKQSTARSFIPPPKARKSVVGLFDTPQSQTGHSGRGQSSIAFPAPFGFTTPLSDRHGQSWSTDGISSNGLPSPALSTLSLSSTPFQIPTSSSRSSSAAGEPIRTLKSELGNEFDGEWGMNAGNHLLRMSSLCDLSPASQSVPPSPSLRANASLPPSGSPSPVTCRSGTELPDGLCTPVSMINSALHISLEPPTPEKDPASPSPSEGKYPSRYRRMSQTVRMRTNTWIDGRFKDSLLGVKINEVESANDASSSIGQLEPTDTSNSTLPNTLASAFEVMVEKFTSSGSDPGLQAIQGVEKGVSEPAKKNEKRGLVKFMLELWLWLQFAIIILVFLWAMAKRGPKQVLVEADRRKGTPRQH